MPPVLQRVLLSPVLRVVLGALSVALLALVVAAALVGEDSPTLNLAPTFVYVVFWLGMPLLSVLLGDVWRVLDPWRAIADAVASVTARAAEGGVLPSPIRNGSASGRQLFS